MDLGAREEYIYIYEEMQKKNLIFFKTWRSSPNNLILV
jgi:hypothetical protein